MYKDKSHLMSLENFRSLFDALYPSLCLFANKYIFNMDMSKDIVQEVFIKVWKKKLSFKNHNAIKAYLYTSVKNHCLNYLKSKNYKSMRNATSIDVAKIHTEDYFLAEMVTVETYAQLFKAIEALPEKTAKVIQLTLKEYSTNEIAEELEVTTSTVRTQKSIGLKKLKVLLNNLNQFFLNF